MENRKKCTLCLEVKTLDQFYKNVNGPLGRETRCRDCRKEIERKKRDLEYTIDTYGGQEGDKEQARHILRTLGYTLNDKDNPVFLQFKRRMTQKGVDTSLW